MPPLPPSYTTHLRPSFVVVRGFSFFFAVLYFFFRAHLQPEAILAYRWTLRPLKLTVTFQSNKWNRPLLDIFEQLDQSQVSRKNILLSPLAKKGFYLLKDCWPKRLSCKAELSKPHVAISFWPFFLCHQHFWLPKLATLLESLFDRVKVHLEDCHVAHAIRQFVFRSIYIQLNLEIVFFLAWNDPSTISCSTP